MLVHVKDLTKCLDILIQQYCQTMKNQAPQNLMLTLANTESPARSGTIAAHSSPNDDIDRELSPFCGHADMTSLADLNTPLASPFVTKDPQEA